ncbi:hypothetical protein CFC21_078539 [Triticum aestivum]|uniref:TF-B3 domain-containing protein n=5 Tax=Triticinae TaxID=1648030 RepID=A0A9R1HX19_WHEAT|nr:uncharacterized protein LOC109774366 [Aegilops tauschii subsp. strangulata]XP_044401613.1 uncharacterized protein LOC123125149 [Triticum aestivum]KAF7000931.1 hypothetical protein CFC21_016709 [Triticum aestivum]KAF7073572.1 hypothetical protein CFC21_078539 [Triticum aestivum]
MAAGDVATVFLEMSLGTRLAVSFPAPSTTVADLKRRVSHEHAACFPHLGQIAVQSIKIEHGGSWFHLADSMAVRDAFLFQGINERWHLQVDASPQVDQGMVTQQGHSGGADSANHSAPAPGRGHGCGGSSSRRCGKASSSDEMLPDQAEVEVEAEREQPLTGKGEGSSNGAEQDREQGAWGRRLRPRTQAGKTPITLSSGSSSESEEMDTNTVGGGSSSSSESEEMDNNTVDAPAPQFVVELKKCHFVKQNGQYLNVPMEFGVVHRYTEKKKVLLRMGGESWAVNLKHGLTPTGRPRTSLRYGWQQFRVDNRLRVGETCFFRALPGDDDGDHHVLKVEVRRLDGSYAT